MCLFGFRRGKGCGDKRYLALLRERGKSDTKRKKQLKIVLQFLCLQEEISRNVLPGIF